MFLKLLFISSLLLIVACATTATEYQTAEIIPEGSFDITPSFSTSLIDHEVGIEVGYGLSKNVEVRSGVYSFNADHGEEDETLSHQTEKNIFLKSGIKYSIVEDEIAFYFPVAFDIYNVSETFSLQPTLLYSIELPINGVFTVGFKEMLYFKASNPYVFHTAIVGLDYTLGDYLIVRPVGSASYIDGYDSGFVFFRVGIGITIMID